MSFVLHFLQLTSHLSYFHNFKSQAYLEKSHRTTETNALNKNRYFELSTLHSYTCKSQILTYTLYLIYMHFSLHKIYFTMNLFLI